MLEKRLFLHRIVGHEELLRILVDKILSQEFIPYLLIENKEGFTPLDIALSKRQRNNVTQLLRLVSAHQSSRSVFGDKVDKHLNEMIRLNIDIDGYLGSLIH